MEEVTGTISTFTAVGAVCGTLWPCIYVFMEYLRMCGLQGHKLGVFCSTLRRITLLHCRRLRALCKACSVCASCLLAVPVPKMYGMHGPPRRPRVLAVAGLRRQDNSPKPICEEDGGLADRRRVARGGAVVDAMLVHSFDGMSTILKYCHFLPPPP